MKKILLLLLLAPFICRAQQHVFSTDLDNFWNMRDSVLATTDSTQQAGIVQRLYMDKASDGLKAFMRNKENLAAKWLSLIKADPGFWDALRAKMPLITAAKVRIDKGIEELRYLYPALQPAQTYLLIGIRQQGGTIRGNLSLIGVEVVMSERRFKTIQLLRMGIHEYTHTQQKRPDFQQIDVLTSCIREGACDFVAQLITGEKARTPYMRYGAKHEQAVWEMFKKEMYTRNNDNWVSTGNNPSLPAPDLGYFVGYKICKAYYDKAGDKKAALAAIIELDYANPAAVAAFLKQSGYNGGSRQ